MATGIEYGLIFGLIGLTAVAAIDSLGKSSKPVAKPSVVYDKPVLQVLGKQDPQALSVLVKDTTTGCVYLKTADGITIHYQDNGIIDCPNTVSVSVSQFNTTASPRSK